MYGMKYRRSAVQEGLLSSILPDQLSVINAL